MTSTGPLALAPEIDALRAQFERISADVDALVMPLTDAQFAWKPAPDVWSVAECLEHLNATARSYLPAIDEGIADAIRRGLYAEGPFVYNRIGRLTVYLIEPPPRMRAKAARDTLPGAGRARRDTMAGFHAYQVQYVDRLRQANGIDLARARARSPLTSWIRIPLGSAFAAMLAHERRHLRQARGIVDLAAFPASL
jgi:hypothetical protein